MKLNVKLGATSLITQVFIRDSSSTTGGGLTGLTNASSSLTAYFFRNTDTTATAIALVSMTLGTFTSSGFKEIDATNMPGWYQLCPPNTALASGATSVSLHLKGATNMAPLPIEIQLVAYNPNDAAALGLTNLDTTVSSRLAPAGTLATVTTLTNVPTNFTTLSIDGSGRVDVAKIAGTSQTARDIGASVLLSSGTGTGQLSFTSGVVSSNLAQILGTALTETAGQIAAAFKQFFNIASPTGTINLVTAVGSVTGAVGSVTGAVGSVTARVTANTDQLAGQTVTAAAGVTFPTSVASPTNITAGTITTVTNLTNAPTSGDFTATMKTSLNAATPASVVGAVGSVTGNVGGNVVGSVASVAGAVGSVTGNVGGNVTGSVGSVVAAVAITAAAVQAIWDALTSALTTVGSIGKLLVTDIDATISSRSTFAGGAVSSVTGNVGGNVVGSVASVVARVTANTDQLAGQTVTAAAGVTFPASLASPTNITAGTITTTTNLTNAPTSGDFTAAMKTSLNAATPASIVGAVGSVTGNVGGNVVGSVGSVVADVGITQAAADKAWLSASRTLTSFGTLVADTATAVWAAGTRTLTGFGTLVSDTAAAVWAAGARTLTAFGFTVTTDVSAVVTTNLDATVSSRLATSGYTVPPTVAQNADGLLGRSIGGGSNGGHTVQDALRPLRNKVTTAGATLTVYAEDDTTIAWTGALTTDGAALPITEVDPA